MEANRQMASSKEHHNEVKSPKVSAKVKESNRKQHTDEAINGDTSENNRGTRVKGYTPQDKRYHSYHHQERHRNFRTKRYIPVRKCYVCGIRGHMARNCFQSVDGAPQSPKDVESEENESDKGPEENMAIQNYSIADCIKRIIRLNGPTA